MVRMSSAACAAPVHLVVEFVKRPVQLVSHPTEVKGADVLLQKLLLAAQRQPKHMHNSCTLRMSAHLL
jgi:hypothetical protein